ncbi:MAG TPA: AAA family ATPase [Gaiellales bacterium]|nr:AAA family ATPase [Gaiellales bacterium]
MSQRVVILNGPAGVGKTTIARLLAARSANGVCIHGDALSDFIVTRDDLAVELGLAYVNGATLAANSIRAGYELVVFEYCFEAARHVRRFLDAYDAEAPVSMFTLWAPLGTVVEREGRRVDRRPLGDRVEACYRSMESNLAELGEVVDNLAAPEDVAARLDALSAT